eukprot:SAG25_NODE_8085_length_441_cov_0.602339_1_plen_116_part_10
MPRTVPVVHYQSDNAQQTDNRPVGVGVTTEIVSTANGKLRCSFVGERTRQCAGVPFAAAPTGDLRWRPPAPAQRWQGVRDATSKQPSCIPGNARPKAGATDEDCLYLGQISSVSTV